MKRRKKTNHPIYDLQKEHREQLIAICKATKGDIKKIDKANDMDWEKERAMGRYSEMVVDKVQDLIIQGVSKIIEGTLLHYTSQFEESTELIMPEYELNGLYQKSMRRFLTENYKGKTLTGRFRKIKRKVRKNIEREFDKDERYTNDDLPIRVYHKFYSDKYRKGGTLKGRGDTLLVAEENRLYDETAVSFFMKVGVAYVRFMLTPQHDSEDDVCNKIANHVDPTVEEKCRDKGINPTGVYRIEELPEYPHPRAFYYLKPIYDLGFNSNKFTQN